MPEDRFVVGQLTKSPYQQATIFQTRIGLLLSSTFAAVAIGIAREALQAFIDLSGSKKPRQSNKTLAEFESVANTIGRAEAKILASHYLLHNAMCVNLWNATLAGDGDNEERAIECYYASAFAAQNCNEAVQMLLEAAGGTGVYRKSPLERCFRDAHMVSKHLGSAPSNYTRGGRYRLGLGFSLRRD